MRGYPKNIATKQDFINLLAEEEHKDNALSDLLAICNLEDSKATRATTLIDPDDPEKGWNTEIIDNPMPMWKLKGFDSLEDLADLIIENGGMV